jgi:hypothetical protein
MQRWMEIIRTDEWIVNDKETIIDRPCSSFFYDVNSFKRSQPTREKNREGVECRGGREAKFSSRPSPVYFTCQWSEDPDINYCLVWTVMPCGRQHLSTDWPAQWCTHKVQVPFDSVFQTCTKYCMWLISFRTFMENLNWCLVYVLNTKLVRVL